MRLPGHGQAIACLVVGHFLPVFSPGPVDVESSTGQSLPRPFRKKTCGKN